MTILNNDTSPVTLEGDLTISKELLAEMGFLPHTSLEFERVGDELHIKKANHGKSYGESVGDLLRGKGSVKMTTEEILQLMRGELEDLN